MSNATVSVGSKAVPGPRDWLAVDRRWLYLVAACCLWVVAFWQLTDPVATFLSEAGRVRMMLPYHIHWINGLPWLAIALIGTLAALTTGPRLRKTRNVVLIGLPFVANVAIHLSLHAAQSVAIHGLMMYRPATFPS